MKHRFLRMGLIGILFLLILGSNVLAAQQKSIYEENIQRVEDTFRYLDEFYIEKYPEAALRSRYGDDVEHKLMGQLADKITKNCSTDAQKAKAISNWLSENLTYDANASAYPNDALYTRKGNCLSYALLMEELLRQEGIPAVWGDGWRGDLRNETADLLNRAGHAWCFAYIDGKWTLYDPLWLGNGTTDRGYISKWLYLDKVDFVIPVYNKANIPTLGATDYSVVYYVDGRFISLDNDGKPTGHGAIFTFVNNLEGTFRLMGDQGYSRDGCSYADHPERKKDMLFSEAYRDGWLYYGNDMESSSVVNYMWENGVAADLTVMERNGFRYFFTNGSSVLLDIADKDYTVENGTLTVKTGYTGKVVHLPNWTEETFSDTFTVKWWSDDESVVTVDSQGRITAHKPGRTYITYSVIPDHSSGFPATCSFDIQVADAFRSYDISSVKSLPTPGSGGICQGHEDCASHAFSDAGGHWAHDAIDFVANNDLMNGTGDGSTFAPNTNMSRAMLVTVLWRYSGAPKAPDCSFKDVAKKDWFYDAVAWAASEGVVNGVGDGKFDPNGNVTREMMATILHRYANMVGADIADGVSISKYPDASRVASWSSDSVKWAVAEGIISGAVKDGKTVLDPQNSANRAVVATIMMRFIQNVVE